MNCKKCNNHKEQKPCKERKVGKHEKTPKRVEIYLPEPPMEEDFMRIPVDEYAALVAAATRLEIIERWAKAAWFNGNIPFNEIFVLLGVEEDDK